MLTSFETHKISGLVGPTRILWVLSGRSIVPSPCFPLFLNSALQSISSQNCLKPFAISFGVFFTSNPVSSRNTLCSHQDIPAQAQGEELKQSETFSRGLRENGVDVPRFRVGSIHIHEAPIMERRDERKNGTSNMKVQDSDTQWTYPYKDTGDRAGSPRNRHTPDGKTLCPHRSRPLALPQVPRVPVSPPPRPLGFSKT